MVQVYWNVLMYDQCWDWQWQRHVFPPPTEPHFLHAIEYGNYVYFFFSEIAVEYTTLGKVKHRYSCCCRAKHRHRYDFFFFFFLLSFFRSFSPEWLVFVRTTTVVRPEFWSVTGRRSSKPVLTAPSPVTPSSTLMSCSRWPMFSRSTTGQQFWVSLPHRPTGQ